jgi:phenylalanyl-tRNA synthetase alpha chain
LHKDDLEVSKRSIVGANDKADSITSLHPIEKKILLIMQKMGDWISEINLANDSGLTLDQLRRGIEWLKYKNLIELSDSSDTKISLNSEMLDNSNCVLPERKLVNIISDGKNKLSDVINSETFQNNEKEAYGAIRYSKNNKWIVIEKDEVKLLPGVEIPSKEENLINRLKTEKSIQSSLLSGEDKIAYEELAKRTNVLTTEKQIQKKYRILNENMDQINKILQSSQKFARKLDKEMLISHEWKNLHFEQIDVEAPLPLSNFGKKNPLIDFIDEVKEILISMGFSEIDGNLSQSSFWNFDALFIPQDHSAREMQDTFYLSSKTGLYSTLKQEDQLVDKVSQIHESNWNYKWNVKEAETFVLRTHTTPVTLQHLWNKSPDKDKVFLIGRVFRNEKVTFKHLVEFHQVEGIYTSSNATLRQLIGIQSEFYSKLGIKKIKFWPTFFPYTEPSLQSMVYNDKLNKWIELFGMGIFRTEVTRPLGIKNPVLAWGGGFERLAMLRFSLDDIRELYSNNLSWLKSVPKCQL